MSPRRAVLLVHRWAGLTLGLLVTVVCLSGSLVVFREDLDRLVARPAAAGPRGTDLDAVAAALRQAHPTARVAALTVGTLPGAADAWALRREDRSGWTVFTAPDTGAVLGSTEQRWWSGTLAWIARFHHDLWLPPAGGIIVGLSGLALVFFCLSGVYLWWPGLRRWGSGWRWRWDQGGRARQRDLHCWVGLVALPGLVLAGLTGAMFEFTWLRRGVHAGLGGSTADAPAAVRPAAQRPRSTSATGAELTWTQAWTAAQTAVPDGDVARLVPPRQDDAAATWRVVIAVPGTLTPRGGATVQLDRRSGAVLEVQDPRHMSLGGWLLTQHFGVHVGAWGGAVTKVLWILGGLVPVVLLATGLVLWRQRHRGAAIA